MVKEVRHRSRRVAALLAIVFVGMFGVHKFYIGKPKAGIAHVVALVVALVLSGVIGMGLPFAVVAAVPCVEGIIYALKSDERFDEQYVYGERSFL